MIQTAQAGTVAAESTRRSIAIEKCSSVLRVVATILIIWGFRSVQRPFGWRKVANATATSWTGRKADAGRFCVNTATRAQHSLTDKNDKTCKRHTNFLHLTVNSAWYGICPCRHLDIKRTICQRRAVQMFRWIDQYCSNRQERVQFKLSLQKKPKPTNETVKHVLHSCFPKGIFGNLNFFGRQCPIVEPLPGWFAARFSCSVWSSVLHILDNATVAQEPQSSGLCATRAAASQ